MPVQQPQSLAYQYAVAVACLQALFWFVDCRVGYLVDYQVPYQVLVPVSIIHQTTGPETLFDKSESSFRDWIDDESSVSAMVDFRSAQRAAGGWGAKR